jgi:hypothetical protein
LKDKFPTNNSLFASSPFSSSISASSSSDSALTLLCFLEAGFELVLDAGFFLAAAFLG